MVLQLTDKKAHEIIADATAKYPNLTTLEAIDAYKSDQLTAVYSASQYIPDSKLQGLADQLTEIDNARAIALDSIKASECA